MIKNLDPRKLLEEKFRPYFLCECGDHSSEDTDTESSSVHTDTEPTTDSKNSVHLALHEGYELSRPTQFLKQYGPYVLGMLQVLKFCLDAAKFVTPAISPVHETLSKVADHVKSVSENKMVLAAIDLSMNYLQTKLGSDGEFDAMSGIAGNHSGDDIFKNLAALEGADLRQLESFLRNKDKDKVLGNLYRVTTPEGHVKWVCLEHVRTSYRENAMRSLLNTIDVNRGFYDMRFRKIIMTLPSSILAKDFMSQLVTYPFAADELDLTMDFEFDSADLKAIVMNLAKSNVKILKLDLNDKSYSGGEANLLSKGKYHSLFELLSNRKLQQLTLTGTFNFGSRTSDLPKDQKQSTLRSFHFHSEFVSDIPRCSSILPFCANLVDLRIVVKHSDHLLLEFGSAFRTLTRLGVLHLIGESIILHEKSQECPLSAIVAAGIKLRELVVKDVYLSRDRTMDEVAHACESTLEVLILDAKVDLQSPRFKYKYGFPKLTHLETCLVTADGRIILGITNFTALRSLAISNVKACDLLPLWKSFPENGGSSQIESLSLELIKNYDQPHPRLMAISLRKMWLMDVDPLFFTDLIKNLVFSKLEVLAVPESKPQAESDDEDLISARQDEFSTQLTIHMFPDHYGEVGGFKEGDIKKLDLRHVKIWEGYSFKTRHDLMAL
ncbi:hypothetical protein BGX26_005972 [Mortierella sp. AD094]|nr:hypothetical protein BGX26_005972 [Mortierella sp. AD094]